MSEKLTLKWGTLKGWDLTKDGAAMEALKKYHEVGRPLAFGVPQQRDTPEQKEAIYELIDALDAETVYLDWDGKYVTKDEAKEYVMGYGR